MMILLEKSMLLQFIEEEGRGTPKQSRNLSLHKKLDFIAVLWSSEPFVIFKDITAIWICRKRESNLYSKN